MKTFYAVFLFLLLAFGCVGIGGPSIKDLNDDPEKYVGEKITVSGTAKNVVKIGSLSGYSLFDEEGNRITVSSQALPAEGSKKTVSGVYMHDTIFGYYLKAQE
ncbi:MAG: hypothetical protein QXH30_00285 [Candidatus Bilamarchaeaceae archaeon]